MLLTLLMLLGVITTFALKDSGTTREYGPVGGGCLSSMGAKDPSR